MKYIKLFEEWKPGQLGTFKEKYDSIKPLPKSGYINGNLDELRTIAKYLDDKGYENAYNDGDDLKSIEWKYISVLSPSNKPSFYNVYNHSLNITNTDDMLKFIDYFKFKLEFRGHNLKTFGV